jgi:hypothetical protein
MIALRQRWTDGLCVLVTPEHTYEFEAAGAGKVFERVLRMADAQAQVKRCIDQEAVDMFVGSVLSNDAGRTPVATLKAQLRAAIEASEAWG